MVLLDTVRFSSIVDWNSTMFSLGNYRVVKTVWFGTGCRFVDNLPPYSHPPHTCTLVVTIIFLVKLKVNISSHVTRSIIWLFVAVLYLLFGRSRSRGRSIILVGLTDSGKTLLFSRVSSFWFASLLLITIQTLWLHVYFVWHISTFYIFSSLVENMWWHTHQ